MRVKKRRGKKVLEEIQQESSSCLGQRRGWDGLVVALNLGVWQARRAETGGIWMGRGGEGWKGGWHPQDQPHQGNLFTYNQTGTQGGRVW